MGACASIGHRVPAFYQKFTLTSTRKPLYTRFANFHRQGLAPTACLLLLHFSVVVWVCLYSSIATRSGSYRSCIIPGSTPLLVELVPMQPPGWWLGKSARCRKWRRCWQRGQRGTAKSPAARIRWSIRVLMLALWEDTGEKESLPEIGATVHGER